MGGGLADWKRWQEMEWRRAHGSGGSLRWMWQQQKWRMKKKFARKTLFLSLESTPNQKNGKISSHPFVAHYDVIAAPSSQFCAELLREERSKNKGDGRRDQSKNSNANLWLCVPPFFLLLSLPIRECSVFALLTSSKLLQERKSSQCCLENHVHCVRDSVGKSREFERENLALRGCGKVPRKIESFVELCRRRKFFSGESLTARDCTAGEKATPKRPRVGETMSISFNFLPPKLLPFSTSFSFWDIKQFHVDCLWLANETHICPIFFSHSQIWRRRKHVRRC